jgi:hypothetical protein
MRKVGYKWLIIINLCCSLFLFITGCQNSQENSVNNDKVPVKEITGIHDIFFEFAGSGWRRKAPVYSTTHIH